MLALLSCQTKCMYGGILHCSSCEVPLRQWGGTVAMDSERTGFQMGRWQAGSAKLLCNDLPKGPPKQKQVPVDASMAGDLLSSRGGCPLWEWLSRGQNHHLPLSFLSLVNPTILFTGLQRRNYQWYKGTPQPLIHRGMVICSWEWVKDATAGGCTGPPLGPFPQRFEGAMHL